MGPSMRRKRTTDKHLSSGTIDETAELARRAREVGLPTLAWILNPTVVLLKNPDAPGYTRTAQPFHYMGEAATLLLSRTWR
jgi:hypothetical protein